MIHLYSSSIITVYVLHGHHNRNSYACLFLDTPTLLMLLVVVGLFSRYIKSYKYFLKIVKKIFNEMFEGQIWMQAAASSESRFVFIVFLSFNISWCTAIQRGKKHAKLRSTYTCWQRKVRERENSTDLQKFKSEKRFFPFLVEIMEGQKKI